MRRNKKLTVAIVTVGRFHLADLARELVKYGHEVHFYSDLPPIRLHRFNVFPTRVITFWSVTILSLLERKLARYFGLQLSALERFKNTLLDYLVSRRLARCDVLIGMSGITLAAGARAKKKYQAQFWLERTSRHILSQRQILKSVNAKIEITDHTVRREILGYELADRVNVPSGHVRDSFLEQGFAEKKIFVNPFGVDLSMFNWIGIEPDLLPTMIMVGIWTKRKACHVLVEAWQKLGNVKLIHVGPVDDVELPNDGTYFKHYPAVDQSTLATYYAQAHMLVLPSFEDGFGMVLSQALACGLSIIASDRTGAPDLQNLLDLKNRIVVVPAGDGSGLAAAIETHMPDAIKNRNSPLPKEQLTALSWERFGRSYDNELQKIQPPIRER